MSPGPNHATFPAHPSMGLSLSSFLAAVTPPLSPSSPPTPSSSFSRGVSVSTPSPVTQDTHSQSSCLRLHARPSIVRGPFFCRVPATPIPWRLASGVAGYNLALPVSFPPSPHAPWHTSRLWGSFWEPLVYIFLPSPKGQRAAMTSDGAGKVTLGLSSTVVTG